MNFLAHLVLAGDDDDLRLGALLGDFVRGSKPLEQLGPGLQAGVRLHRHIDAFTDALPAIADLRKNCPTPFRRYAGIIIDLVFDYELASRWHAYREESLEAFDVGVRDLLARRSEWVPAGLASFMAYADRRGLFATYRERSEIVQSLVGIGARLSRPNPLHQVDEIWEQFEPGAAACFEAVFSDVQSEVAGWLVSRSITTGS